MIPKAILTTFDIGDGRSISLETGKVARQANGSVILRMGKCVMLATVCATKEPRPGQSFFPLSVDYRENFYAAGRIPGSFFKREGRISDYEILISRLIDRALRPLFPSDYLCEVQILINLLSADETIPPDALACLAASAALAVSDIPIQEVISEVRIAQVNGEYVVNPTFAQLESAKLEFIVAATEDNIMMVEGEAKECDEEELLQAIFKAHEYIKIQIAAQKELSRLAGETPKYEYIKPYTNPDLYTSLENFAKARVYEIAKGQLPKAERNTGLKAILTDFEATLPEETPTEDLALLGSYFHDIEKEIIRNMMLDDKVRLDGRKYDEVRPLTMEVDYLPSPHGSALFTRGETQALGTVTLGAKEDELLNETALSEKYESFYLHYKFPPFSTGEVKPMRGPGRREVGHGNLAQRSIEQLLPKDEFPYTVRIVSDIMESNGSSSMATVCAASLSLMDAGVPFKKHMAGVAMGLISRPSDKAFCVLTDILGDEDHLGDMDFKVTGTRDGICGIQMDIKVDGLSMDIMRQALLQAKAGRLHILEAMYQCLPEHRAELKPHAPRIERIIVDREFIGAIIGPGGKNIQELQRNTNTTISIEEVNDRGEVTVFSTDGPGMAAVRAHIKGLTTVPEPGTVYPSVVKSIKEFGAFMEFLPGKQGLLHISEYDWARTDSLDGLVKEGDRFDIKLLEVDKKTGKYKLSRKALIPRPPREG